MNAVSNEVSKEQLITDFKVVMADAEALLKATAHQGDDKIIALRAKAEESLRTVKDKLAQAQETLVMKSREAAKATDVYVHENPWNAIGVAAGVGLLVGYMLGRR